MRDITERLEVRRRRSPNVQLAELTERTKQLEQGK